MLVGYCGSDLDPKKRTTNSLTAKKE